MIYLDTSVALAHLLGETLRPPATLWDETLIASRLLQYELMCRVNGRGLSTSHGEDARQLVGRVALVELAPVVLERALEHFPFVVRTLDAIHLATMAFLRSQGHALRLASYDDRLLAGAASLGVPALDGLNA
ncbi:MAG: PIN domain-containing protein [Myxococcota bacterium]